MPANFDHRLSQLQSQIADRQAFFLTTPTDIEYYTGFECLVPEEREAFLIVTQQQGYLIHASFSPTPPNTNLIKLSGTQLPLLTPHLQRILKETSVNTFLVDKTHLYADEFETLQHIPGVEVLSFDRKKVWQQRMSKDESEVAASRRAGRIAIQAFDHLTTQLKVGMTEKEVQRRLDYLMSELGSEKPAFPTIVAFGPHGALPHHQPTDTALTAETAILIDFGATWQHYRSDVTRSWWFGDHPTPEFVKIKNLVDEAYQLALEYLSQTNQPRTAQGLDRVCREFLSEAGYGDNFIHTTGHGVGLDIHEPPSLYWKNQVPLTTDMMVTIEPGVYLTDQFGYRWENTLLITQTGYDLITKL